jgi:hypothetical protein
MVGPWARLPSANAPSRSVVHGDTRRVVRSMPTAECGSARDMPRLPFPGGRAVIVLNAGPAAGRIDRHYTAGTPPLAPTPIPSFPHPRSGRMSATTELTRNESVNRSRTHPGSGALGRITTGRRIWSRAAVRKALGTATSTICRTMYRAWWTTFASIGGPAARSTNSAGPPALPYDLVSQTSAYEAAPEPVLRQTYSRTEDDLGKSFLAICLAPRTWSSSAH